MQLSHLVIRLVIRERACMVIRSFWRYQRASLIATPSWHRYTVIPHEYYHVYQLSRSGGALCKWMLEGTAACFESLYIKQYEGVDYFDEQSYVTSEVLTSPSAFEDYSKPETNYSNSVFMVLVLHKELVNGGETDVSAFSKIFRSIGQQICGPIGRRDSMRFLGFLSKIFIHDFRGVILRICSRFCLLAFRK